MSSFVRQHKGAVLLSVALHVAVVAGLTLGLRLPGRPRAPIATQLAIEAIVVDEAALNREIEKRERAERQETQRRQREEQQVRDAARKEEARVAEVQLQRERAERQERERAENAKREQERVAEERRQREQREHAETERRQREEAVAARQRADAEADLQRVLAAEAAEEATLLAQYVLLIENRIEQKWIKPLTARAGLECVVDVVQIPGGDIIDVRVGRCNGDEATIRSIEAAVKLASPLPPPPKPSLFARNLHVTFRPDL